MPRNIRQKTNQIGDVNNPGEITSSGDNTFSGENTFSGTVNLNGTVAGSGLTKYHVTGTTTGTDTYVMTSGLSLVEANLDGMSFSVSFGNANSGPSTLNIDGIGAKSIVKEGSTALAASDLSANRMYTLAYDGTNFQVQNVISSGGSTGTYTQGFIFYAGVLNTTTYVAAKMGMDCTVTGITLASNAALSANDTNYWTFTVDADTDNDGTGDVALLSTSDLNTTKLTGGQSMVKDAFITLDLTGTAANLDLSSGDSLLFKMLESGSAPQILRPQLYIQYIPR